MRKKLQKFSGAFLSWYAENSALSFFLFSVILREIFFSYYETFDHLSQYHTSAVLHYGKV